MLKYALRLKLTPATPEDIRYAYEVHGEQFIHESGTQVSMDRALTFLELSEAQKWADNPRPTHFPMPEAQLEIVTLEVTHKLHIPAISETSLHAAVQALYTLGKRVTAIKLLREATGLGLKEAKEKCDEVTGYNKGEHATYQFQYLSKGENARWVNIEHSELIQAASEGFRTRTLAVC